MSSLSKNWHGLSIHLVEGGRVQRCHLSLGFSFITIIIIIMMIIIYIYIYIYIYMYIWCLFFFGLLLCRVCSAL